MGTVLLIEPVVAVKARVFRDGRSLQLLLIGILEDIYAQPNGQSILNVIKRILESLNEYVNGINTSSLPSNLEVTLV